jgi:hypothetical protein
MKTTFLTLVITLAVALGFIGTASAQTSFTVSNQQFESLGTVTVTSPSGDYYLAVPGNSNDTVAIADTVTSITIYSQIVPQSVQAYVTLADGTVLAVMWVTPSSVIVVDRREIE